MTASRMIRSSTGRTVRRAVSTPNRISAAASGTADSRCQGLAADIRIMDTSAFVLANEQALTMHVFDVAAYGAMRAICEGDDGIGTKITAK